MEQIDCTPPEHILPGSKERPLVPLQPQNKDWKVSSRWFMAPHMFDTCACVMKNKTQTEERSQFSLLCPTAHAVPEDPDDEWLEPSTWE